MENKLYIDTETNQFEAANMTALSVVHLAQKRLETRRPRSAWKRGVAAYASDFLSDLETSANNEYVTLYELSHADTCRKAMLNGAQNWSEYSCGGSSLICDEQIAKRLCTPSELKKTRNGERRPNRSEEWLDTQARALSQAARLVYICIKEAIRALAK